MSCNLTPRTNDFLETRQAEIQRARALTERPCPPVIIHHCAPRICLAGLCHGKLLAKNDITTNMAKTPQGVKEKTFQSSRSTFSDVALIVLYQYSSTGLFTPQSTQTYACMYVGGYVCMYVCMHACMYVCMSEYVYVYVYVCLWLSMNVCNCLCMSMYAYVCICMYVYVYVYIICIYIYLFTIYYYTCFYIYIYKYSMRERSVLGTSWPGDQTLWSQKSIGGILSDVHSWHCEIVWSAAQHVHLHWEMKLDSTYPTCLSGNGSHLYIYIIYIYIHDYTTIFGGWPSTKPTNPSYLMLFENVGQGTHHFRNIVWYGLMESGDSISISISPFKVRRVHQCQVPAMAPAPRLFHLQPEAMIPGRHDTRGQKYGL